MTRDEHLAWCKKRALQYVDAGELANAVASMGSDLNKHEGTRTTDAFLIALAFPLIRDNDAAGVRRWIEGFN